LVRISRSEFGKLTTPSFLWANLTTLTHEQEAAHCLALKSAHVAHSTASMDRPVDCSTGRVDHDLPGSGVKVKQRHQIGENPQAISDV
jgi:hypothetical protein